VCAAADWIGALVASGKVGKVMHEFKSGKLRSGKVGPGKGPKVGSRKQAMAIALSEARRVGERVSPKGATRFKS
jgi:uncharacterized protein DUF6496